MAFLELVHVSWRLSQFSFARIAKFAKQSAVDIGIRASSRLFTSIHINLVLLGWKKSQSNFTIITWKWNVLLESTIPKSRSSLSSRPVLRSTHSFTAEDGISSRTIALSSFPKSSHRPQLKKYVALCYQCKTTSNSCLFASNTTMFTTYRRSSKHFAYNHFVEVPAVAGTLTCVSNSDLANSVHDVKHLKHILFNATSIVTQVVQQGCQKLFLSKNNYTCKTYPKQWLYI